jgi:ribosomal protein S18 acetylase RimI-like enzyme
LLLATYLAKAAGCVAFHRIGPGICEMKRMYVRPEFRGLRIGRDLAETLIATARQAGYGVMRLETTTFMEGAQALYASLGFRTCEPYYVIPQNFRGITVFMELDLRGATLFR